MNNTASNSSIGCTVTQCKYNHSTDRQCTLDKIMVGTHEQNPTEQKCTDCQSFQVK